MLHFTKFNIIHIPKTAVTWIRLAASGLPKGYREHILDGHVPYCDVPEALAKRPTYVIVRNPWDWYVSFYTHHNTAFTKREGIFAPRALSEDVKTFGETVKGTFEEFINCEGPLVSFPGHQKGATFTSRLDAMTEREDGLDRVLRFHAFEEGVTNWFIQLLDEHYGKDEARNAKIRILEPQNVHEHAHYSTYYTEATRDLVAKLDAAIIRDCSYKFEDGSAPAVENSLPITSD